MIGKQVFGLAAILFIFILILLITIPVTAAEKMIQLNIPGCNV